MSHRLAICFAIASSLFVAPRSADAAFTHAFDTVDAVDLNGSHHITVTGILAGQTTPTTMEFGFYSTEYAQRCERMALLAMSKPGKYQLHIGGYENGNSPGCKLIRLAP